MNIILILLSVLSSAALQNDKTSWVGQQVFFKKQGIELMDNNVVVGTITMINALVHQENVKQIKIIDSRGKACWVNKEDAVRLKDAEGYYTKAIVMDKDDLFAYTCRARVRMILGRNDIAVQDLTECLRINPDQADAWCNRAYAWIDLKEYDNAMADCREAIRLDPEHTRAYIARARVWSMKNDFDRALTDANEALRIDPTYTAAYSTRGNVWKSKKNYGKAMADFDEAIRLTPSSYMPYYNKACCFAVQSQTAQALDFLERSLELGYPRILHMEKDPDLDSVRKEARYKQLVDKYKTP